MTRRERIGLIDGKYAAWPDLNPAAHGPGDDAWAKRLTHWDPDTSHGWAGEWVSSLTIDGVPHFYIPPAVGGFIRVAGNVTTSDPEDANHKVLRLTEYEPDDDSVAGRRGGVHVEVVGDREAIRELNDSPVMEARMVAHAGVQSLDVEDLAHLISYIEAGLEAPSPDATRRVREVFEAHRNPNLDPETEDTDVEPESSGGADASEAEEGSGGQVRLGDV